MNFELPPEQTAGRLALMGSAPRMCERAEVRKLAQEGVIRAAAIGHALFIDVPQAIITVDPDGKIIDANPAARNMFGRTGNEFAGRPFETVFPKEFQAQCHAVLRACFGSPRPARNTGVECTAKRRNASSFSVELRLRRVDTGRGLIALAFLTDISRYERAPQKISPSRDELRALNARLISMQEESRKKFARELHDVITQQVAVLGTNLSRLRQHMPRSARDLEPALLQACTEINQLATDIHDFARRLHPSILDELGLVAALKSECRFVQERYGIRCTLLKRVGVPMRVPDQVGLAFYRIAQEAIRNSAQHANSPHIRLTLRRRGADLIMAIADNGRGFDFARARRKRGMGLISMEERARLVDGVLSVNSRPGSGTTIELRLPLKDNERENYSCR